MGKAQRSGLPCEALTSPTLLSPGERRENDKKELFFLFLVPLSPLGREGPGE
jgi:hypothetical protein